MLGQDHHSGFLAEAGATEGRAFQEKIQLLPKILPKEELERKEYPGFPMLPGLP